MPEHLALVGIKALRAVLMAAETRAKDNVEIGRTSNIGSENETDAIDINIGVDVPPSVLGPDNTHFIDSVQQVFVDLHTRTAGVNELTVVEQMFELRAQTHNAILADETLGEASIIAVRYQGTDSFDPEQGGDRLGSMRTVWDIAYRMRYADATLTS